MKLEDIQTIWGKDSQIDGEKLDNESIKIPQLHNKYYIIYSDERLRLKSFQFEMDKITKLKREYFGGRMDKEELDKLGWVPFPFKLLKNDIEAYIHADEDVIKNKFKIMMSEEKVNYLESIIKTLNNRNFLIKNAIDWRRFTSGAV